MVDVSGIGHVKAEADPPRRSIPHCSPSLRPSRLSQFFTRSAQSVHEAFTIHRNLAVLVHSHTVYMPQSSPTLSEASAFPTKHSKPPRSRISAVQCMTLDTSEFKCHSQALRVAVCELHWPLATALVRIIVLVSGGAEPV